MIGCWMSRRMGRMSTIGRVLFIDRRRKGKRVASVFA
jgi:hypothetical protein